MNRVPDYHHTNYSGESRRATQGVRPDNYSYSSANLGQVIAQGINDFAGQLQKEQRQQQALAEKAALIQTAANVEQNLAVIAKKHKTDPEGFKQEAEEKKAEWLQLVPADKAAEYNLLFTEQQANFSSAVVRNQISAAEEYQKTSFLEASDKYRDEAFKAARLGNTELQNQYYQNFLENRYALFKGGHISSEKYVAMGKDFANGVEVQNELGKFEQVIKKGDQAVAGYLYAFEKRRDLTPDRKSMITNALSGEYNNYKVRQRILSEDTLKQADFVINSLNAGIMPQTDPAEIAGQLRNLGNINAAKKVEQSQQLYYDVREFAKLSRLQMSESLKLQKENIQQPEDLVKFQTLSKFYTNSINQLQKDPLAYAAAYGVVKDEGFSWDDNDKIKTRLENAKFVKAKYNLAELPVATKAEIEGINDLISQSDAATKGILLGQLYAGYGENSEQIIRKIAPKSPEFAHAAAIFKDNPAIAANLLQGVEISKKQPEYTPSSEQDFDTYYYKEIGSDLFADASPKWREGLKKSVKSYLAKINFDNGKTDRTVDNSKVKEAVQSVIGNIVTYDRPGLGSGEFKTVAPRGLSADEFNDWIDSLQSDVFKSAVTLDGYVPTADEVREYGSLTYYGPSKYRVFINGSPLYNPDGNPFVLTYGKEN